MEKILTLIRELDVTLERGNKIDQLVAVNALNCLIRRYSPNATMARRHRNDPTLNEQETICVPTPFLPDR